MMSKKQWSAMLCLHITYLLLGASIFYHIEGPLEMERRLEERRERLEIQKLIHENYFPSSPDAQIDILIKLTEFCGRTVNNVTDEDEPAPVWDFYHSFFFSYTVVSTIGYGNLAPTNTLGRILMIFYGLFGIPINGILFANLGEYFGNTFRGLYKRYKSKNPSSGSNIEYQVRRFGLVGQISMYLIPGFLFFIFMPACFFVIFEGWDYALAVYYAFVTLTTIGFGDYVAGITDKGYGVYFTMYKIFLIFWITFGLGYLVMVFGFITRGLRSKRMIQLEHKLALNLKETHSKIWNGVTKDVGYLRRMLNEVYMMRFKPVYHDEIPAPRIHRSSSCPSLSFAKKGTPEAESAEQTPELVRRRANSEAYPPTLKELQRVQSDTDLLAIDRNKTFAASNIVQPAEFLAKVVDALGSLRNEDDDFPGSGGIHGFSDDEILASERHDSGWSMGGERFYADPPRVPRARAVSEVKVSIPSQRDKFYSNSEWTWSSPAASNKIKEMMKARQFGKMSAPNIQTVDVTNERADKNSSKTLLSKLNPFKRQNTKNLDLSKSKNSIVNTEIMTPDEYLRKTARGRVSAAPAYKYLADTRGGRASRISLPSENAEFLEKTTIADLIRALTALHSGKTPDAPRRKLGTASLTPPRLPSLLTLFPPVTPPVTPPETAAHQRRRFSVHPAIINPDGARRTSMTPAAALPAAVVRRRFSLYPATSTNPIPTSSFTPTLSPLVSGSVIQPRRGSLFLPPPPYTPTPMEPSSAGLLGRRRMGAGQRRLSLRGTGGTPSPRARRPIFPPIIREGRMHTSRTRHESLSDISVEEMRRQNSSET